MIQRKEENDSRNYFMINLLESMGPGRDRTRDPWICSQTRICCQTLYRMRYAARYHEYVNKLMHMRLEIISLRFGYRPKYQPETPLSAKSFSSRADNARGLILRLITKTL